MNLAIAMYILKKNARIVLLSFIAVVVVQLILTISMAQLMMHMTLDVKCKEKEWNAAIMIKAALADE